MSLIPFPFVRLSYPSLGNPAYVDDIVASNQQLLDGISALLNGGVTGTYGGFAIISGLAYNSGTQQYGTGVIYFNGTLYGVAASFGTGLYLTPASQNILNKPFSDTNSRLIYTQMLVAPTSDPTGGGNGATPVFNGSMNQYRFDLNTLGTGLQAVQAQILTLGTAAYLNVGVSAGTVAAGNDSRFGYSIAAANTLFATKASVLLRGNPSGNNTGFVPSDPYDPMTLVYAQNNFIQILAKGYTPIGNADPSGGTNVNIGLGVTLGTNAYKVLFSIVSLSSNPQNDTYWNVVVIGSLQTTSQFTLHFRQGSGATQNIAVDWMVVQR